MIKASGLTEQEGEANLKRMLLDPHHGALRYLFYHPNPYYTTNTAHYGARGAAIITPEQLENIVYFFIGACDPNPNVHEPGFDAEARKENFTRILADINRAHNDEALEILTEETEAQASDSPDSDRFQDDELLDSPSCNGGILGRLHQLNIGRTDYQVFIKHQLSHETLHPMVKDFLLEEFWPQKLNALTEKELILLERGISRFPIETNLKSFKAEDAVLQKVMPQPEDLEVIITKAQNRFRLPAEYVLAQDPEVYEISHKERVASYIPYIKQSIQDMPINYSSQFLNLIQTQQQKIRTSPVPSQLLAPKVAEPQGEVFAPARPEPLVPRFRSDQRSASGGSNKTFSGRISHFIKHIRKGPK